jgi:hypothetical protein
MLRLLADVLTSGHPAQLLTGEADNCDLSPPMTVQPTSPVPSKP